MMVSNGATLSAAANFFIASALPTLFGYIDQNSDQPAGEEAPLGAEGGMGLRVLGRGVWGETLKGTREGSVASETSCSDELRRFSDAFAA